MDDNTATEIQYPKLRELVLHSLPDDTSPAHPRQEAHRLEKVELLAQDVPLPPDTSFPSGGLEGLQKQQNAFDAALKAKKEDDDARRIGLGRYAPDTWHTRGLDTLAAATIQNQSQAPCRQPEMDPSKFETKLIHEDIMALCRRSSDVPRYGHPNQTKTPHRSGDICPEHVAWRNRVIEVWIDSTYPDIRQCDNADSFHSSGTEPCKWGWGRMFHEYASAHDQSKMESDDLNSISAWFRQKHAGEPRFQSPEMTLQSAVTDPSATRYHVLTEPSEAR